MTFRLLDLPTELIVLIVGAIDHFPTLLNLLESKEICRKIAHHTTIVYNGRLSVFSAFEDTLQTVSLSNMESRGWPTDPLSILLIEDFTYTIDVTVPELLKKYQDCCRGRAFLHLTKSDKQKEEARHLPWRQGISRLDKPSSLAAVHLDTLKSIQVFEGEDIPEPVKRGRITFGRLHELKIAGLHLEAGSFFHVDKVKKLEIRGCDRYTASCFMLSLRDKEVRQLVIQNFQSRFLDGITHFNHMGQSIDATSFSGPFEISETCYIHMRNIRMRNATEITLGVVCNLENCVFDMDQEVSVEDRSRTMTLYTASSELQSGTKPVLRDLKMYGLRHLTLTCIGLFSEATRVVLPSLSSLELNLITVENFEMFAGYDDECAAVQSLFGRSPINEIKVNSKKALVACAHLLPGILSLEFNMSATELQNLPADISRVAPQIRAILESEASPIKKVSWGTTEVLEKGDLAVIGQLFPNLLELNIECGKDGIHIVSTEQIESITWFRNLKTLHLKGAINQFTGVEKIFEGTAFPVLDKLKLQFTRPPTFSSDVVISIRAPLITSLEYDGSHIINNAVLKLHRLPKVSQLIVRNCKYLSIAECPTLRGLTIEESEHHTRAIYFGTCVKSLKNVYYLDAFYHTKPPNIYTLENISPDLESISMRIISPNRQVYSTLKGFMSLRPSGSEHYLIDTTNLAHLESVGISDVLRGRHNVD